ncbi:dephospho-CoA kinase [Epibacterium ulvae]|uniref:dephospho-CoA kinase n=1 Tax=Epibacterium ulvae TaxID=1156985 RepID=UPI00249235DF|nr:dephospho-CoA kinase [Epibacterium ulvae]
MSFCLGLTGSIGMGKSTTARMFKSAGCAIWDADQAVHRLYEKDGAAVAPIAAALPEAITDNTVDRRKLRDLITRDSTVLVQLETIVHPLVQADRKTFRDQAPAEILVFDIPLLFETGAEIEMDAVACVHVSAERQKERVLARGTMTEVQFQKILEKQMPISEKLTRSEFRIETDTLDHAQKQVEDILTQIRKRISHA